MTLIILGTLVAPRGGPAPAMVASARVTVQTALTASTTVKQGKLVAAS